MVVNYVAGLLDRHADRAAPARRSSVGTVVVDLAVLAVWKYAGFASDRRRHAVVRRSALGRPRSCSSRCRSGSRSSPSTTSATSSTSTGASGAPMRNPLTFATYIAMFPQLVAGPIVRYHEIADQLRHRPRPAGRLRRRLPALRAGAGQEGRHRRRARARGRRRLRAPSDPQTSRPPGSGALAYTCQIYFDFSGYSDMAIGLGRMFGFRLPENFEPPLLGGSITDFWRRWHMSLSRWFRDYVYIPLGGNRGGAAGDLPQPVIVFFAHRLLARRRLDLPGLGLLPRRAADHRAGDRARPGRTRFAVPAPRADLPPRRRRLGALPGRRPARGGSMLRAMVVPSGWASRTGVAPDRARARPQRLVLLGLTVLLALLPATFVLGRVVDGRTRASRSRLGAPARPPLSPYAAVAALPAPSARSCTSSSERRPDEREDSATRSGPDDRCRGACGHDPAAPVGRGPGRRHDRRGRVRVRTGGRLRRRRAGRTFQDHKPPMHPTRAAAGRRSPSSRRGRPTTCLYGSRRCARARGSTSPSSAASPGMPCRPARDHASGPPAPSRARAGTPRGAQGRPGPQRLPVPWRRLRRRVPDGRAPEGAVQAATTVGHLDARVGGSSSPSPPTSRPS